MIAVIALLVTAACSSSSSSPRAGATRSASPTRGPASSGPTVSPRPTSSAGTKAPAVTPYTDVTGASMFAASTVTLATLRKTYPGVAFSVRTVRWDGVVRAYLAAAPSAAHGARAALPLFVVLSGYHSSSGLESERTGFLPLVSQGKAVAVYPVGYHESWDVDAAHSCCHEAAQRKLDDEGFVAAATRDARTAWHTDADRTYLVGHSNGAKLAFTLACGRSDLYAAVATMAAVDGDGCDPPAAPISALVAVGDADTQEPSAEHSSPPVPLLDATAIAFRRRDHCTSSSRTVEHELADVVDWRSCGSGTAVRRIVYSGVRHSWPASGHYRGATRVDGSIALATLIEQFVMSRHR
ncbi:alpha/beta hydrolase family esterase [uncultured Jatrophihabitans sp.]|uniref:alpha/beta hydrolase family esterase n=1 Tax=uncultured Jatrophihabitans sp. TaxID=1610747 RepID=UPI0035C9B173